MAAVALAVVAADRITKALVESRISARAVVRVIPGLLNLTHTTNSGAVFGVFDELSVWWKTPVLVAVSAIMLMAVAALAVKSQKLHWVTRLGLALILGGALSNLYDRIVHSGRVVDFLDFYFRHYHWATFNLADSAIVVGTGLVIVQVLLDGK